MSLIDNGSHPIELDAVTALIFVIPLVVIFYIWLRLWFGRED